MEEWLEGGEKEKGRAKKVWTHLIGELARSNDALNLLWAQSARRSSAHLLQLIWTRRGHRDKWQM